MKLIVGFFLVFPIFLQAQASIEQTTQIEQIKNGIIVVRLDMQINKIEAYQKIIDNPNISEKERNKTLKFMAEVTNEREAYKNNVIEAFSNTINFTNCVFIENQKFRTLLKGSSEYLEGEEYILNQINAGTKMFFLIQGDSESQWILTDKNLNRVNPPLKSKFDIGFRKFLDMFAGKKRYNINNMNKVASKINGSLHNTYNKR